MRKSKKHYIFLKKRAKETYKNLIKRLNEYNEELNTNIDFHTFFVNILSYSEDDYTNLINYRKKLQEKAERREKHQFNPNKPIPYGKGDIENPEYNKYFNIFVDYTKNYLSRGDIKEKKTLKGYFKLTYGYNDDKALEESKKIQTIVFSKKRAGINNKLIIKESNNELRVVGIV